MHHRVRSVMVGKIPEDAMKWRFSDYEAELRAAKWFIIVVVCLCFAASAMVLLLAFYKKVPAPIMKYEQSTQRHAIAATRES